MTISHGVPPQKRPRFRRATGFFAENVVDVAENLFEHNHSSWLRCFASARR
jgi:hypothetical protein